MAFLFRRLHFLGCLLMFIFSECRTNCIQLPLGSIGALVGRSCSQRTIVSWLSFPRNNELLISWRQAFGNKDCPSLYIRPVHSPSFRNASLSTIITLVRETLKPRTTVSLFHYNPKHQ